MKTSQTQVTNSLFSFASNLSWPIFERIQFSVKIHTVLKNIFFAQDQGICPDCHVIFPCVFLNVLWVLKLNKMIVWWLLGQNISSFSFWWICQLSEVSPLAAHYLFNCFTKYYHPRKDTNYLSKFPSWYDGRSRSSRRRINHQITSWRTAG